MPHIVIEYSDNVVDKVDSKALMQKIHERLYQTELFDINDIKSRIIVHSDYYIGDGSEKRGFVTLTLSILSGRSKETKKMLSVICLKVLKEEFSNSLAKLLFSITVQVKELDKDSYGKITSY